MDEEIVERNNTTFCAAAAAGDAAGMAAVYTPDACVLAAGADIVNGVEAIEGFWRTAIEAGGDGG